MHMHMRMCAGVWRSTRTRPCACVACIRCAWVHAGCTKLDPCMWVSGRGRREGTADSRPHACYKSNHMAVGVDDYPYLIIAHPNPKQSSHDERLKDLALEGLVKHCPSSSSIAGICRSILMRPHAIYVGARRDPGRYKER